MSETETRERGCICIEAHPGSADSAALWEMVETCPVHADDAKWLLGLARAVDEDRHAMRAEAQQTDVELARLRGVVEAVQALADEWERRPKLQVTLGSRAQRLRAVLAPVSSSGEAGCPDCGGPGVVQEAHDGGTHPVHCHCTAAPSGEAESGRGSAASVQAFIHSREQCAACGHDRRHHGTERCSCAQFVGTPPAPVPSGEAESGEAVVEHETFAYGQSGYDGDACRTCRWEGPPGSAAQHRAETRSPAPVSSGGQADGPPTLAEHLCSTDDSMRHHEATDDYPCSACVRLADRLAPRLAARPVLFREALRARLDGHWPTWRIDPASIWCDCGWSGPYAGSAGNASAWRDHLADVLTAGGEQRG